MRRAATTLFTAAIAVSTLASAPAADGGAADSSEGQVTAEGETAEELITPDPLDVTMYFHGMGPRYVDEDNWLNNPQSMDPTEPEGSDFESKQLFNYAVGPNPNCAGNGLFPVWSGFVGNGTIVGEATVTFTVAGSTGGDVTVHLWQDVTGQACNDDYPTPDASATVTLPVGAGTVEVSLPTDGLAPGGSIMVQLQPASQGPASFNPTGQARVLYDGAAYPSSISFTCQPDDVETEEQAAAADCDLFW